MNPAMPYPGFDAGCNIILPICSTSNQWLGAGPAPANWTAAPYQVSFGGGTSASRWKLSRSNDERAFTHSHQMGPGQSLLTLDFGQRGELKPHDPP